MLSEKRKRFYSTWMDGRPIVVDVATGVVHFDSVADRAKFKADVILVEGQRNISEKPAPDYYLHRPADFVLHGEGEPLSAEAELTRTGELLQSLKFPSVELTVGDLSIAAEDKQKHRVRDGKKFLRNVEEGLSVGDLTDKEDDNKKGLDGLFVGRSIFEPAMTESAQIDGQRVARRQKEIDQAVRVRNMLLGGRDEALERYLAKYLRGKREKEPKQKV